MRVPGTSNRHSACTGRNQLRCWQTDIGATWPKLFSSKNLVWFTCGSMPFHSYTRKTETYYIADSVFFLLISPVIVNCDISPFTCTELQVRFRIGQYKCKFSSLQNHRLLHVTFLTCQTCVQSDFTMVILWSSAKIKFHIWRSNPWSPETLTFALLFVQPWLLDICLLRR